MSSNQRLGKRWTGFECSRIQNNGNRVIRSLFYQLPGYVQEPKMGVSRNHTKRVCWITEVPGANRNRHEATELLLMCSIGRWLHSPELLLLKLSSQANVDLRQRWNCSAAQLKRRIFEQDFHKILFIYSFSWLVSFCRWLSLMFSACEVCVLTLSCPFIA